MIIGIVDCETTGLGQNDEIITLAIIYGEVDEKGKFVSTTEWYGERHPAVGINPSAYEVHGRTLESLKGKSINLEELQKVVEGIAILVAHNCKFDARMLSKLLTGVKKKEWRCSYTQWPWPSMVNSKLDTVCAFYGVDRPKVHGALEDARALMACLLKHSGKTERSMTCLKKLLKRKPYYFSGEQSGYSQLPSNKELTIVLNLDGVGLQGEDDDYWKRHREALEVARQFGREEFGLGEKVHIAASSSLSSAVDAVPSKPGTVKAADSSDTPNAIDDVKVPGDEADSHRGRVAELVDRCVIILLLIIFVAFCGIFGYFIFI